MIVLDIDLTGYSIVSSGKSGYTRFSVAHIMEQAAIPYEKLLAIDTKELFMDDTCDFESLCSSSPGLQLPDAYLWEKFLLHIIAELGISSLDYPQIYTIFPSWLNKEIYTEFDTLLTDCHLGKVHVIQRNYAIAQAYAAGIPTQFSAYIAVIEIRDGLIILSPVQRKEQEWQIGKAFTRKCSTEVFEEETFGWIFALLDELCHEHEFIVLLDSSEEIYAQIEERKRLFGKAIRIELVHAQIVLERILEFYESYAVSHSSILSENVAQLESEHSEKATVQSTLHIPPRTSGRTLLLLGLSVKQFQRSLIFLCSLLVFFGILWGISSGGMSSEKRNSLSSVPTLPSKDDISLTAPSAVVKSRIIPWNGINFLLPAGWEMKTPTTLDHTEAEDRAGAEWKKTQFLVHTTRPWEIIALKFIPLHLSLDHLRSRVSSRQNLRRLQELAQLGQWQRYQYEEFIPGGVAGTVMVRWTILGDPTISVQIGCIYAQDSIIYPACQEVIESIHR